MKKQILLAVLLFIGLTCFSQTAQDSIKLPGDTSLPSSKEELAKVANWDKGKYKYSVEDFYTKPKVSDFQLSPDGKYISYREIDETGQNPIYIKDLKTNAVKKVVEDNGDIISSYGWKGSEKLILVKDQGGNQNFQIYVLNITDSESKTLTPFKNLEVHVLDVLIEQKDFILICMNKDNPNVIEPYKLNIVTGDFKKLYEIKDPEAQIFGYDFDKDGNLRTVTQQINGENDIQLLYRTSENSPFELVVKTNMQSTFYIKGFNYNSKNPHEAFVVSNLYSDKIQILRYDLKEKKVLEVLFQNDTYDLDKIYISQKRNFEIDGYGYEGEKYTRVSINNYSKNLNEKITKALGDKLYDIVDKTYDEDKYLLYVQSDKYCPGYFLYDSKVDKLTKIADLKPNLKEEDMAENRLIQFKSRDGLIIYGYLTIPKGGENKKNPLIVNPHGGPYDGRDDIWGFNTRTQILASRGYATLRLNFRGTSGYGKEFQNAGFKQIGRKMLDDLEDGTQYVISLGLADKEKIAVYGSSYGGLATLGSLMKTPDLYQCGVDLAGPSNIVTFINKIPPDWKAYYDLMCKMWYDPNNPEEKKIMEAVSPALHADKITKPVMVVHGGNDPIVDITEADQIVKALRNKGFDVPYMVKYDEGHEFYSDENLIEMYKTILGFLSKHLKKE